MENYLTSSQSTTTTPFYKDFTTMPIYNTLGASVTASSLSDSYRPTLIGDASQEKSPVKLNPTSYTTSYSPYYNRGCSSDSKSGARAYDSITDGYFSNFNTEDRNGYQLASSENDLYRSLYKDPQTPETKTKYSVDSILSPYQPAGDLGNNQASKDSESMSTQDSSAEKSDEEEERDVEATLKRYPVSSGLPNLGNTCYMNSVLQCLFNTEKLCDALEKNKQEIENSQRAPLTQRFLEILKSAFTKHSSTRNMSESLRPFKKALEKVAPIFKGYSQNDAHELFRLLTEKMHDELNQAPKKSGRYVEFTPSKNKDLSEQVEEWKQYSQDRDDSLFTSLFGGILLTEVKCNHCNHVSYTFEDALDLSLNLANLKVDESSDRYDSVTSLYTCLKDYATPEFVDGYACDKCKRRDSSFKRTTVWKQPETLVVQLKRFVYDMYGDQETVKDLVSFPLKNLRLDEIMHEESNAEEARYQLYGIVNHFGSLDFGHYTAYVYNDQQKCWYQYNDDQVTRMDDEDMREFARGSSEPYILFYRKI